MKFRLNLLELISPFKLAFFPSTELFFPLPITEIPLANFAVENAHLSVRCFVAEEGCAEHLLGLKGVAPIITDSVSWLKIVANLTLASDTRTSEQCAASVIL